MLSGRALTYLKAEKNNIISPVHALSCIGIIMQIFKEKSRKGLEESKKPVPAPPAPPEPPDRNTALPEPKAGYPPLFIKIERYRDIVKNIQRLRSYSLSLRDALDALSDVEKELKTGLAVAQKVLDDFNTVIAILESKLMHTEHMEEEETKAPRDVEEYIRDVHEQIEKIKNELGHISE